MRKLVWLMALLLSVGLWLHWQQDQTQIALCYDQGETYDLHSHLCSTKEANYHSYQGFIGTHVGLFGMWIFSMILAIGSIVIGVVTSRPENENSTNINNPIKRLLVIDNYDSFTYNLVQYFGEIGQQMAQEKSDFDGKTLLEIVVKRNDEIDIKSIEALKVDYIVISPGPCTPDESGISKEVITHFGSKVPILGVCLGHQAMAQVYGGDVIRAEQVMHGKTSKVYHNGKGVFSGLSNPFDATRYHSLIVKPDTLPNVFQVTAWTQNDDGTLEYIMGIKHKELPMQGVQFHPESILSEHGHQQLRNFLDSP